MAGMIGTEHFGFHRPDRVCFRVVSDMVAFFGGGYAFLKFY